MLQGPTRGCPDCGEVVAINIIFEGKFSLEIKCPYCLAKGKKKSYIKITGETKPVVKVSKIIKESPISKS